LLPAENTEKTGLWYSSDSITPGPSDGSMFAKVSAAEEVAKSDPYAPGLMSLVGGVLEVLVS
jgi:hypothetical protein